MNDINFNPNYNLSFCAKQIGKSTIKKITQGNNLKDYYVNFVRFDKNDEEPLRQIIGDFPVRQMTEAMIENLSMKYSSIYGLTTQRKNLKKLDPSKVLAMAETNYLDNSLHIKYLQTKNDCKRGGRRYKHVGKAMMKSIIQKAKNEKLDEVNLFALSDATPFYKKLNFASDGASWHFLKSKDFDKALKQ